ncbi:MAG: DUF2760 domain-containing protein [Candidatus Cloacimonetes bacterium]|nr:DUF2760 domain-containing protein [Candidatus Cloacimonadota bacterium]
MRIFSAIAIFFKVLFDSKYFYQVSSLSQNEAKIAELEENLNRLRLQNNLLESSAKAPVVEDDLLPGACALLSLMQREARFLDFTLEDISQLPDEQVGAVSRLVHGDLKKLIRQYMELKPVIDADEGQKVSLGQDRMPYEIQVASDRDVALPFTATLRHKGYRLVSINLPQKKHPEAVRVLMPAELDSVEVNP